MKVFRFIFLVPCACFLFAQSAFAGASLKETVSRQLPASHLTVAQRVYPAILGPVVTLTSQSWNGWDSTWVNDSQSVYKYNANGDVIQDDFYRWSTKWDGFQIRKSYESGHIVPDSGRTTQMVEDTEYVDFMIFNQTYMNNLIPTFYLEKRNLKLADITDKFGDALHDFTSRQDIWKPTGYLDTEIVKSLDLKIDTTGNLVNDIKFWIRFNNQNKNDLQRVYLWLILPTETEYKWFDLAEHQYTYDSKGNRTRWIMVYKEPGTSTYVNYQQELYHYNTASLKDTTLVKMWDGAAWVTTEKTVIAYNAKNKPISESTSTLTDTVWTGAQKISYTYDASDTLLIKKTYAIWFTDGTVGYWQNDKQELFDYNPVGIVPKTQRTKPASTPLSWVNRNGVTSFTFSTGSPAKVSLTIYDLKGAVVHHVFKNAMNSGSHTILWNRSARFGKGTYLCRLTTPSGSTAQRLIISE